MFSKFSISIIGFALIGLLGLKVSSDDHWWVGLLLIAHSLVVICFYLEFVRKLK